MSTAVKPIVHELKTVLTPIEIASILRLRSYSFFLDSSLVDTRLGRYSFMGFDPFLVFQSKDRDIQCIEGSTFNKYQGNVLEELGGLLSKYHLEPIPDLPPFYGGVVGYFAYDFSRQIESLPNLAIEDVSVPDCVFGFYDVVFAFDNINKKSWIISSGFPEKTKIARDKKALQRLNKTLEIIQALEKLSPVGIVSQPNPVLLHSHQIQSNFNKEQYFSMIHRAQDYIAAGDIYQVNLAQRFKTQWENSSWDLYLRLRHFNPAPYSAYLNGKDFSILSSSPERFLRISGKEVETRPIKGTRPRGKDPVEDNQFRMELINSAKDRAELVMIVDLERNDLGKVCEFGSVKVETFPELESYATVWHLVGTVKGILEKKKSHLDCLSACYPGGSITGAPKIRAMELIDELEPHRRGVYTGSIGYFGFNQESDFNIAIRTMVLKNQNLYFHSGGGITTDSDPEMEYEETLHKAKALFQAVREIPINELIHR